MEKSKIVYKGKSYPIVFIELNKISNEENRSRVAISDIELWYAIEKGYDKGDKECINIDNSIYYYCDSGFIASNPSEEEIINEFKENYGL